MKTELKQLAHGSAKVIDASALGVTTAALMEIVPAVTALASFVWVCLRIYNSVLDAKLKRKELNKVDT